MKAKIEKSGIIRDGVRIKSYIFGMQYVKTGLMRTIIQFRKILFLLNVTIFCGVMAAQERLEPDPAYTREPGKYISRTMHLLATSTPRTRNTVRIMVYGQSVSAADWWIPLKEDLVNRFPHADIVMTNRAIGGFASQRLWKTVGFDIINFYPDLVIFHVFGSPEHYERILKDIRSRTTAEMVIWNDHYNRRDAWNDSMSYHIIPGFCDKYKLQLLNVRDSWKDYLNVHGLDTADLLKDGVHLNAFGNFVLAKMINSGMVYDPALPVDPYGMVKEYEIGRDVFFRGDTLTLPFDGNRVDAVTLDRDFAPLSEYEVLINGRPPSEYQACYIFSRPNDLPHWPWDVGSMYYIQNKSDLVVENWTLTIDKLDKDHDYFEFDLVGSVTGPDGSGNSHGTFVSNSGRIVIDPEDWHIKRSHDHRRVALRLTTPYTIEWSVIPMFRDRFTPEPDEDPTLENAITMVKGLENGHYTLKLVKKHGSGQPLRAIRVYRPFWGR